MLAVAILAAGQSQRMGQPKALVPFQGLSFVEHLITATRHARIGATRVVLGAGANEIRAKLPVDAGSIVVNSDWPKGQLSSIHAAIRSLPAGGNGRADDMSRGSPIDFTTSGGATRGSF